MFEQVWKPLTTLGNDHNFFFDSLEKGHGVDCHLADPKRILMFIGHMDNPDKCGEWKTGTMNGSWEKWRIPCDGDCRSPFCGHFGIVLCFSGQNRILILSDAGIGEKPKGVPSPIQ